MWFVANVLDRENDVEVSEVRVGVAGCDDDMTALLIINASKQMQYVRPECQRDAGTFQNEAISFPGEVL